MGIFTAFFAVFGTAFNIFSIGLSLYGIYYAELIPGMEIKGTDGAGLLTFLIYGAILAAVDPVAVLSVFDEIGVDKSLSVLILGESLLNDGVTVVFFESLTRYGQYQLCNSL